MLRLIHLENSEGYVANDALKGYILEDEQNIYQKIIGVLPYIKTSRILFVWVVSTKCPPK